MTEVSGGWRPLQLSGNDDDTGNGTTPFTRLARTHAFSATGGALVAAALAGTLFFSLPAEEARGQVALYLLLTMAPFAVVAPLIGPAIDRARGGRRWMIILSTRLRAVVCLLMMGDVDSLLLFPEAFAILVLGKSYHVAKNAVVPATVSSDGELVEANSKLSVLSGIMSFVGAGPGILLLQFGPEWTFGAGALVFSGAALMALRLPQGTVAREPVEEAERAELRSAGILLAASGMALLRGIVGFMTLLLAFDFRGDDVPEWHFGVVAAFALGGTLLGGLVAPRLRRVTTEESMLIGALVATFAAAMLAILLGGLRGAALLSITVGFSAAAGKLAFDSIVQRDAPDANRGRSFARFETRFQLIWVIGAFIPVPFGLPARIGYVVVAVVAGFAAFSYFVGLQMARHRHAGSQPPAAISRAAEAQERLSGAGRRAATTVRPRRVRRGSTAAPGGDEGPARSNRPPPRRRRRRLE